MGDETGLRASAVYIRSPVPVHVARHRTHRMTSNEGTSAPKYCTCPQRRAPSTHPSPTPCPALHIEAGSPNGRKLSSERASLPNPELGIFGLYSGTGEGGSPVGIIFRPVPKRGQ